MAMLSRSRSRAEAEGLDVACPACGSPGRPLALVVEPGCRLIGCPGCGTQYLGRIERGPGAAENGGRGEDRGTGDGATRTGTDSEYWEQQPSLRLSGRLLAGAWPAAERVFRRFGWGNKLVVLARRLPVEDVPGPGATG